MPTIDELKTLLTTVSPNGLYIDPTAFPNTASYVWSGSPYANGASYAWNVYFGDGYSHNGYRYDFNGVRLVRGGQ